MPNDEQEAVQPQNEAVQDQPAEQEPRRKVPAFLTPEEKAARDAEIAEEANNFTPDKFNANQEHEPKPLKTLIIASKFLHSVPVETEDYLQALPERDVLVEKLISNLEIHQAPENFDGMIRLVLTKEQIEKSWGTFEKKQDGSESVLIPNAQVDGITRQVQITITE